MRKINSYPRRTAKSTPMQNKLKLDLKHKIKVVIASKTVWMQKCNLIIY
jgi:hypothetical protein